MPVNKEAYHKLIAELQPKKVTLVAVSKTKSVEEIKQLYDLGHRDFGENYVQEMAEKYSMLPSDIRWHFIGHLQRNKVKIIIPFVQLIQGVDSLRLLKEINKQAEKVNRVVDCLLQVHIAQEETKFGFDEQELQELLVTNSATLQELKNVRISGLMGMATLTDDMNQVRNEFRYLKSLFEKLPAPDSRLPAPDSRLPTPDSRLPTPDSRLPTLSMGMSGDYKIAIEEGSNMIRIGSLIFGERE